MAAKKKTHAPTPAQKGRKADQARVEVHDTPPVETSPAEAQPIDATAVEAPPPAELIPPGTGAETTAVRADNQRPAEDTPPAVVASEAPGVAMEPPPAETEVRANTTLRYWPVRPGPQVLGQTLAGSEAWALKYGRQQFGDGVSVEPGRVAPGPKERPNRERKPKDPGQLSALDAAAQVLAEMGRPMSCPELIGAMAAKGDWSSPASKTPAATLYTAVTMLPNAA